MTEAHSASLRPGRKPIKDWAPEPQEKARIEAMLAKCQKNAKVHGSSAPLEPRAEQDKGLNSPAPSASEASSAEAVRKNELITGAAATSQLSWKRTAATTLVSTCQRYQITKEVVGNFIRNGQNMSNGQWIYWPWVRVEWLWYIKLGPSENSADAAKAACEAHALANPIGKGKAA